MNKYIFVTVLLILKNSFAGEFTIGVENLSYYPHYTMESGQYEGFARDILDSFAKAKGHKFIYKPVVVSELTKDFINGKVDFKYPDNQYWAKDLKNGKKVIYSNSVTGYIDGVIRPIGSKGPIKRLGTVKGFTPWDYKSEISSGAIKLDEFENLTAMLNALIVGKIDGAYNNVSVSK